MIMAESDYKEELTGTVTLYSVKKQMEHGVEEGLLT